MSSSPLDASKLDDGSCLLRKFALQKPRSNCEVIAFGYARQPSREYSGGTDPSNSRPELSGNLYLPADPITGIELQSFLESIRSRKSDDIIVIDHVGCDVEEAKKFISVVVPPPSPDPSATQNPSPSSPPDPASVLDSGGLRKYGDGKFITGISFVASPAPKFLMLFVSIPYLGLGSPTSGSGSRTLRQYRHQSPMEGKVVVVGSPVPEIVVHQTWFLVFNDETIGIFRSEDDPNKDLAPLFPYQQRGGAFHALVQMISNILTLSEIETLEHFRKLITKWESDYPRSKEPNKEGSNPATAMFELGSYLTDLCTMMQVVRSQIKYLEDLRRVFQNSSPLEFDGLPQSNEFEIPFIEDHPEQIRKVLTCIKTMLEGREKFNRELKYLVEELEILQRVFLGSAQADSQQSSSNALKKQGETITVFTFITSIFLPLGFLAGYYGISPDGYQTTIKTVGEFWEISAPVTVLIVLLMAVFLYRPDSEIKKLLKRSRDPKT